MNAVVPAPSSPPPSPAHRAADPVTGPRATSLTAPAGADDAGVGDLEVVVPDLGSTVR